MNDVSQHLGLSSSEKLGVTLWQKIHSASLKLVSILLLASILPPPDAQAGQGVGKWRQKAQLVWDGESRQLIREQVVVWDSHPDLDLEFSWEPEAEFQADPKNRLEGRGLLIWRKRASSRYETGEVRSQYKGELLAGRAHGIGEFADFETGVIYSGQWELGLMHGAGTLRYKNGDYYEGEFSNNLPHGLGRYASRFGELFIGRFVNGERHGASIVVSSGGTKRIVEWHYGMLARRKNKNSLELSDGATVQQIQNSTSRGISVSLVTNSNLTRRYSQAKGGVKYAHRIADDATTIIQIDDKKLLRAWKGKGWLEYGYNGTAPVFADVGVKNNSGSPVYLSELVFKFEDSFPDLQPMIGTTSYNSCVGFRPHFSFTNSGWGKATNVKISYGFSNAKSHKKLRNFEFSKRISSFQNGVDVDVSSALRDMGVPIQKLKRLRVNCKSTDGLESCMKRARRKLNLGRLKGKTFIKSNIMVDLATMLVGRVDYSWKTSSGRKKSSYSKFAVPINLAVGVAPIAGECADLPGSDPSTKHITEVKLRENESNYEMSFSLERKLRIVDRERFVFKFTAPKSSWHKFRVTAVFTDGSAQNSGPILLHYYKPWPKLYENQIKTGACYLPDLC